MKKLKKLLNNQTFVFALMLIIMMAYAYYRSHQKYEVHLEGTKLQRLRTIQN
jgi:hypothetical protein